MALILLGAPEAHPVLFNLLAHGETKQARSPKIRAAGRVCLVDFDYIPKFWDYRPAGTRYALPGAEKFKYKIKNLYAVRQGETDIVHVRRMHFHFAGQLALTARLLGAQQVALAGMPTHNLPGRCHLKALGGAAVRLQLHFLVLLHRSSF